MGNAMVRLANIGRVSVLLGISVAIVLDLALIVLGTGTPAAENTGARWSGPAPAIATSEQSSTQSPLSTPVGADTRLDEGVGNRVATVFARFVLNGVLVTADDSAIALIATVGGDLGLYHPGDQIERGLYLAGAAWIFLNARDLSAQFGCNVSAK